MRRTCSKPATLKPATALKIATAALAVTIASIGAPVPKPDAGRGRALFERRCTGCHALDSVMAAPPLRAVFGKTAARNAQFPYSDALKNANVSWDEATLDRWLADPDAVVPGNDMTFRLENAAERADIVAYLKQLGAK
jgi:cytochrome c